MDLLQLVVVGVIVGSVIGLGAMGLTLTFGILKFANFAHGDMMTLGMFLAYAIVGDLGWSGPTLEPFSIPLGLVLGVAVAGLGVINVFLLIAIAWIMAFLGDSTSFWLGHRLGRRRPVPRGRLGWWRP